MDRETYLQELWARLSNRMPRQELENLMKYYEEYFEEAGEAREQEVIAELGTPAQLADRIMGRERPLEEQPEYEPPVRYKRRWSTGQIIALICFFPIWFPLLLSLSIVVFALVLSAFFVSGAIAAAGLVCVVCGIVPIWAGFSVIFSAGIPTVLFFGGGGILMIALGMLLFLGGAALCWLCGKGTAGMWRSMTNRRRRAVA